MDVGDAGAAANRSKLPERSITERLPLRAPVKGRGDIARHSISFAQRMLGSGRIKSAHRVGNRRWSPLLSLRSHAQLIEQRLSVLQVSGIEAFGEPAVDLGEHCSGFYLSVLKL